MQSALPWMASGLCLGCGILALILRPGRLAGALFFSGMALLAGEGWLENGLRAANGAADFDDRIRALTLLKSCIPGVWLAFSLVYARGDPGGFLRRWKWVLSAAILLPVGFQSGFSERFHEMVWRDGEVLVRLHPAGKAWVIAALLITLAVLVNLEKTFRISVGIVRWRIKYLVIGLALILGVRVYALTQELLFSSYNPEIADLGLISRILGCLVIGVGLARGCFGSFELYPSRAVLQGSVTLVLAGGYFVMVGLFAQFAARLGGISGFPIQALILLFGAVGLAVMFLSERCRTSLQRFTSRHFRRPEHDFRKIWTEFTRRTSSVLDPASLGKNAAEVVSENFHVLGVTIFRMPRDAGGLQLLHTTGKSGAGAGPGIDATALAALPKHGQPADLERCPDEWAGALRDLCPSQFGNGGDRLVVPLVATERLVGLMVLTDRVNGAPYSDEEMDLLKCIGDQLGGALLNVTLTEEVLQAREMEAFQTLSTFFVHDLKNAVNGLGLMLQNFREHLDDPEFRADAAHVVERTVERINQLILRLGSLRRELKLHPEPCRLDVLCAEVLDAKEPGAAAPEQLERDLQPVPAQPLDQAAMRSVVANLVSNARESLKDGGVVKVCTRCERGNVALVVSDNGCGMSQDFIRSRLFRPFDSTKSKGLGIGMFQCRKIVEAHGGSISVESEPGIGTSFTILLPAATGPKFAMDSP